MKSIKDIATNLKIKGYSLLKTELTGFKGFPFIVWKKNNKKEYIRLILIQKDYQNVCFWNLELSFKPFCYKHNHRENSNIQSETFKFNNEDKKYNYFLNMIDKIKVLK